MLRAWQFMIAISHLKIIFSLEVRYMNIVLQHTSTFVLDARILGMHI